MPKPDNTTAEEPKQAIAVADWGSSSFRLWIVSSDGDITDRSTGPDGMSNLNQAGYAKVLETHMAKLKQPAGTSVLICGMAGAAQGWHEAPYMSNTQDLKSLGRHAVRVPGITRKVHILPGVMQANPSNVMRGEETQILGLLATEPNYEGIVCLPGTHTKWVQIQHSHIANFTTCMTGELFALLSAHSVLKHSVAADGWDEAAFESAVNEHIVSPGSIAENLFGLRASSLLNNQSAHAARARLSGMLIGLELAATRAYWGTQSVTLIGEASLCQLYSKALTLQGIQSRCLDAEAMTLRGLTDAYRSIGGQNSYA